MQLVGHSRSIFTFLVTVWLLEREKRGERGVGRHLPDLASNYRRGMVTPENLRDAVGKLPFCELCKKDGFHPELR